MTLQRRSLESRLTPLPPGDPQRTALGAQLNRLEELILMLEWVLNAPAGKYHA
ncbi:hypothetical protein ACFTAO_18825 [Paenibacillus rhizoplanae]